MGQSNAEITTQELETLLEKYIEKSHNLSYALKIVGHPGIGKSALVKQVATKKKYLFIDTRLAFKENVDLGGYPIPNHKSKQMIYFRPKFIPPLSVPKGKKGIVWFLDEANRAHPSVIQTLFQIITEQTCGEHKLPPQTAIILAGNLGEEDDTVITNFNDSALKGRLASFHLKPNLPEWLIWAVKEKIHPVIIKYLSCYPEKLWDENNIDPNPRGWHQVSDTIKHLYQAPTEKKLKVHLEKKDSESLTKIISSLIGQITAHEFLKEINHPRQITTQNILDGDKEKILNLKKNKVPLEDFLWAISGAISYLREKNIESKNKLSSSELKKLSHTLYFISLARTDARLSFFYLLIKKSSLFTQIPLALKLIKPLDLKNQIIKNLNSFWTEV